MTRRRWSVLGAGLALVVLGLTWGMGVFGALTGGGFDDPRSESSRAHQRITDELGDQGADVLVLYSGDGRAFDAPAFRQPVGEALRRLRDSPDVARVTSVYDAPPGTPQAAALAPLVAQDRTATYVLVELRGDGEDGKMAAYQRMRALAVAGGGVRTETGGPVAFLEKVNTQTAQDITRAELITLPILLVLLILIFRGLVAATTPLLIGGLAILGGFVATRLLAGVTEMSVFAINIITLIGMGLAIDYALFVVSRFREELAAGRAVPDAVARTLATAGRTVLVSGLTVALALASLLIFPQAFLRSMGLGGMAAVLVAMLASVTVLPALLTVLGHRINAGRVRLPGRRAPRRTGGEGGWARLARSVMRRPIPYALGVGALLLLLASPFLQARSGGFDERVLPPGSEPRVVAERITADFPGTSVSPVRVVVSGVSAEQAQRFAERIGALAEVTAARVGVGRGTTHLIEASFPGEATGEPAERAVRAIRGLAAPDGAQVLVGGQTAASLDLLDGVLDRLPWMALLMASATLVLLFLAFGSVLLPVKAVLMNAVSIGASFGVVVWGFQQGHLADLLDFTSTGFIEPTNPILMLAVLFGLATDYEVFLLSRVREEWDRTGDNTTAVATGLQHTGRIITAAALLLVIVVAGFASGGIMFIKMIGVGMIVAIVVDATLVRALLVPATMRLLGRWNWWAPGPLAAVYRRFGIRESVDDPPSGAPADRHPVGAAAG
ncbi:MAG TPA: MMPL family transporter [Pilimelia sp.]|nr:MMPL family transporter [Pilimelia sp.]